MATPLSTECTYTAKLGYNTISTANSNLDGTGSILGVITGASNGTFVKTIIIKAQTDTSVGMIRLFVKKSGGSSVLLTEVFVSPIIKSGRDLSYYNVININYCLESGEQLSASTQNADTFNIVAEAFDYSYTTTTNFIGSSLAYTSNSGVGVIDVANPNLNGSGTMTQIITAGSSGGGFKGCVINSIIIKAQVTTTPGIVRLFIKDDGGGSLCLFTEVLIPSVVRDTMMQSFDFEVIERGSFCIPPGYSIWAATEIDNRFSVIIEGFDWKNL